MKSQERPQLVLGQERNTDQPHWQRAFEPFVLLLFET